MKIIMQDFVYKGEYIKEYSCELPQCKEIDKEFEERIVEYIKENLDELINK